MNVFELFGKIAVDNSGAMSGIDQTVGHAKKAENNLSKTFKKIGGMVAAAFSVRAVVDFGKQCTQAYASIAAEESAFAQIMGDYADTAQAKLKAVADQTGITSTRMTGAMTSLTAKFKGLGYNVEDATTLASDGLLIAADAAAFWDMSLEESMSHLNSFINGSYEGGEAIGLFANDTQMAAYAVEQGIVADTKAWAALDEATKQATRLDYAKKMMQNSGATGQAAKEASAYANVMANLKESWRQFQGVVGKPILEKLVLPAMQKLNEFMPKLTEGVQKGIVWLENGFDKIKEYFADVFTEDGINVDALPDAMSKMFRDLGSSAGKLLRKFGQTLRSGWSNTVWPAIQGVAAKIGIELPPWSEIESKVKNWWDGGNGIAQAIADVCNWTLKLFGAPADVTAEDVKSTLSEWWSKTVTFVQDACSWVLKLFNNPTEAGEDVKNLVSSWWSGVVGYVRDACNWTLNLFGAPANVTEEDVSSTLSSWWSNTVNFVRDACAWSLKLFDNPKETIDEIIAHTQTWWSGVVSYVRDVCTWSLRLPAPPDENGETAASALGTWWSGVKPYVQSACDWALNIFKNPPEVTAEEVEAILDSWWTNTKGYVQSACDWVLNTFGAPAEETAESVSSKLSSWWTNTQNHVQDVCQWTLNLFNNPTDDQTVIKTAIEKWWNAIRAVIEGACNWTLKIFDFPEFEDVQKAITDWWNSIKDKIKISLPFGLGGLFGSDDKKGKEENGTVNGTEGAGSTVTTDGSWKPNLHTFRDYRDFNFGDNNGANSLPGTLAALNGTLSSLPAQIEAAAASGVADGVSGITVTGSITTGNVTLDTGALVGKIAPRLNLTLGNDFGRKKMLVK